MQTTRFSPRLVAFFALPMVAGCKSFEYPKFNAKAGVDGPLLVVPFSEPKKSLWYGESADGSEIAEAIKEWARQNADPELVEGEDAIKVLHAVRDWQQGNSITPSQWQSLTRTLGVQFVVYGEIESLSLTKEGQIGLLQPVVRAHYRVIDVGQPKPKSAYDPPAFEVEYGDGEEIEMPLLEMGANLAGAKKRLLVKLGARIGKDLYGYYRE